MVAACVCFAALMGTFNLGGGGAPSAVNPSAGAGAMSAASSRLPVAVDRVVELHTSEAAATLAARIAALENPPPPPADSKPIELAPGDVSTEHGEGFPTGYIRKPRLRLGAPENPRHLSDDGKLHIVFSSGCNFFQHWQAEMVLASAFKVGQRGRITRIVSGCHDVSAENIGHQHQTFPSGLNDRLVPMALLNRSVNPYFGLYVTPSFDGARDFPWINKPSGINHFLTHAMPEIKRLGETVIAILDPDFIFLKPLTQSGEALDDMIYSGPRDADPKAGPLPRLGMDVVRKGRPVAQRYGLGGQWVGKFDVAAITGANSHATTYSSRAAADHFSVGPPLLLHIEDALPLSKLWKDYMKPVLAVDTDILADMWAYCMAAAHLNLEHTIIDHHMISTWGDSGQAFSWVNNWKELSCRDPESSFAKKNIAQKSPTFIHLASNFKAPRSKEWMFHKGKCYE